MCVCVCLFVCVSVPPEISDTGGRITTLLTLSWRASPGELHKLLFKSIRHAVWEKSLWKFFASYVPNPAHAPLLFLLPWAGWMLSSTTKPLEHSWRVCIEGHALHIMGTIVAIALYVNGLLIQCYSLLVDMLVLIFIIFDREKLQATQKCEYWKVLVNWISCFSGSELVGWIRLHSTEANWTEYRLASCCLSTIVTYS